MTNLKVYDAFTGLSISKKKAIIGFFNHHLKEEWLDTLSIQKAIEYAIKEIPSFGGFIITVEEEQDKIIGTLIVNKTGMEGYMPQHIVILKAISQKHTKDTTTIDRDMIAKAIALTKGDIAIVTNNQGTKSMQLQSIDEYNRSHKVPLLRKVQ